MTALRARFLQDLQLAGLADRTCEAYVRAVRQLAEHCRQSPDSFSEAQVRDYFSHLKNERHFARGSLTIAYSGIKFFFRPTAPRDWRTLEHLRVPPGGSLEAGRVRFRWKKSGSRRWRTMELDALEFLRRFLQHVLPPGFQKVRHYGFLSPQSRVSLEVVRALVATRNAAESDQETDLAAQAMPGTAHRRRPSRPNPRAHAVAVGCASSR